MASSGHPFYTIAVTNLFHGAACLLWIYALKRVLKPLASDLYVAMLQLALVLPVGLAIFRACSLSRPPEQLTLLRTERWAELLQGMGLVPQTLFFCSSAASSSSSWPRS